MNRAVDLSTLLQCNIYFIYTILLSRRRHTRSSAERNFIWNTLTLCELSLQCVSNSKDRQNNNVRETLAHHTTPSQTTNNNNIEKHCSARTRPFSILSLTRRTTTTSNSCCAQNCVPILTGDRKIKIKHCEDQRKYLNMQQMVL